MTSRYIVTCSIRGFNRALLSDVVTCEVCLIRHVFNFKSYELMK